MPPPDRRRGDDRRAAPTSPFTRSSLFGSRKRSRRKEDHERHRFVDRYSPRSIFTVVAIIVLSIIDATFTLRLIDLGAAREANPLMDYLLRKGPWTFFLIKFLLTTICVLACLVLKNFKYLGGIFTVKWLLVFVFVLYALLIVYEISLFRRIEVVASESSVVYWGMGGTLSSKSVTASSMES